jgi:hypothetical protein
MMLPRGNMTVCLVHERGARCDVGFWPILLQKSVEGRIER